MNIKKFRKKSFGFTLIELLVVMAIAATMMGMVGPIAMKNLEKAQAREEVLLLEQWLKNISYRAYSSGQKYLIELDGKAAKLYAYSPELVMEKVHLYEYMFFQPQQIQFNSKGFVSAETLNGVYGEKRFLIDLNLVINKVEKVSVTNG